MKRITLSAAALLATTFLVAACGDDDDDPTGLQAITYTVPLTTAAERPTACTSAGGSATGSVTITVNAANTTITVTDLTFSGLSGAVTMAHIHSGTSAVAGPVVIDFGIPASGFDGVFDSGDYLAPAGAPATFAAFMTALRAGNAYVNVHTAACGPGEIRGQID